MTERQAPTVRQALATAPAGEPRIRVGEFNVECIWCGLHWSRFDSAERHEIGCPNAPPKDGEVAALIERCNEAIRRITGGAAPMRIPVDSCDADVVLADCKATLARLSALQPDPILERARELRVALIACVAVTKAWHGVDAWDIYYNHSPEMKPIRDVLGPCPVPQPPPSDK